MVRRRKHAIIKFREKIRVVVALRGLNKTTFVSQKNKRDFVQSAKGGHNANCPSILRRGSARARTRASARARVFARFLMVRRRKHAIVKFRETIRVVAALRGLNKIAFVSQKTNAISFNPRKAATTQLVCPFLTRERARARVRPPTRASSLVF